MAGIREVYNRFKSLRDNLPTIAENSLDNVKPSIVESQKDQLEQGVSATGGTFKPYKNAAYARKKNQMNPAPGYGNPDYKYHGDYYKGIVVVIENGKMITKDTDKKAQWIEARDKNVLGLSPQYMEDFLYNKLKPVYHQNILDFLKR